MSEIRLWQYPEQKKCRHQVIHIMWTCLSNREAAAQMVHLELKHYTFEKKSYSTLVCSVWCESQCDIKGSEDPYSSCSPYNYKIASCSFPEQESFLTYLDVILGSILGAMKYLSVFWIWGGERVCCSSYVLVLQYKLRK